MNEGIVIQDHSPVSDEVIIARLAKLEEQPPEPEVVSEPEAEQPEWDMRKLQGMDQMKTWDEVQADGFIKGKMFEETEPDTLIEPLTWDEAKSGVRASWSKDEKKQLEARRRAKLEVLGFSPDTVTR